MWEWQPRLSKAGASRTSNAFPARSTRQVLMLLWQRDRPDEIHVQKLDWMVLAICLALAWPMPGLGEPYLSLIEKRLSQFARNKGASLVGIGSAAIVARLALF